MSEGKTITVAALAERLNAPFEGDGTRALAAIEPLEQAGPAALSWLGNARYQPLLATTQAGAVLVPPGCEVRAGLTVIRVADPDLALCDALRMLGPAPVRVPPGVHPSAVVDPSAKVAGAAIGPFVQVGAEAVVEAGTQLHAGVYIGEHVRIGRDCIIWPGVVIRERVSLGARVVVHPNTTVGGDGFGYLQRAGQHVKIPQIGTVVIEDDVEIGANTTIDRARSGQTRIGRGAKIDNLVQIGHNCDIGPGSVVVAQAGLSGSVKLGKGVVLAGQVGVVDHIVIGDGAVVTAQAGIMKDLPGGKVYGGSPARDQVPYMRQLALIERLPELQKQIRELNKRVHELESAAHDPEGS